MLNAAISGYSGGTSFISPKIGVMENLAKTMDKNNNALNYLKQKNKKFT
jgi:hypothetical protein